MVRHQKTHLFCDAKETSKVLDVKRIVEGILQVTPENQQLYRIEDEKDLSKAKLLDDGKLLSEAGLSSATARAQQPAILGLALKKEDGTWEALELTKVSDPPELPDVMKSSQSDTSTGQLTGDGQTIS